MVECIFMGSQNPCWSPIGFRTNRLIFGVRAVFWVNTILPPPFFFYLNYSSSVLGLPFLMEKLVSVLVPPTSHISLEYFSPYVESKFKCSLFLVDSNWFCLPFVWIWDEGVGVQLEWFPFGCRNSEAWFIIFQSEMMPSIEAHCEIKWNSSW